LDQEEAIHAHHEPLTPVPPPEEVFEEPLESPVEIPIFDRFVAGAPILAIENIVGWSMVDTLRRKVEILSPRFLEDETIAKRLFIREATTESRPGSHEFRPVQIAPEDNLRVCGKVAAVNPAA